MDNNFIKDNRDFPEEMQRSYETADQTEKNHSTSIMWWIAGLLVLLVAVFFVGLWAGKQTTMVVQERNNDLEQERRQAVVEQQRAYADFVSPQERSDRLRSFFAE